jgi:hypothetical protein
LSLADLSLANARASGANDIAKTEWDDDDEDYEPNPAFMLLNEVLASRKVSYEPGNQEQGQTDHEEEFPEDDGDMTMSQLGAGPRYNESVVDDQGDTSVHTPQRN